MSAQLRYRFIIMKVSIASGNFHLFLSFIDNLEDSILVSMLLFHLFHEILENIGLFTFWILSQSSMLLLPLFTQDVRVAFFYSLRKLAIFIKV